MMASGLVGCSNSDKQKEEETTTKSANKYENQKEAAVYINDDNALVFLEDYSIFKDNRGYWLNVYGNPKYISELYTGDICEITYRDKDELESKVRAMVGQDGQITYQEDYGKVKK